MYVNTKTELMFLILHQIGLFFFTIAFLLFKRSHILGRRCFVGANFEKEEPFVHDSPYGRCKISWMMFFAGGSWW